MVNNNNREWISGASVNTSTCCRMMLKAGIMENSDIIRKNDTKKVPPLKSVALPAVKIPSKRWTKSSTSDLTRKCK